MEENNEPEKRRFGFFSVFFYIFVSSIVYLIFCAIRLMRSANSIHISDRTQYIHGNSENMKHSNQAAAFSRPFCHHLLVV